MSTLFRLLQRAMVKAAAAPAAIDTIEPHHEVSDRDLYAEADAMGEFAEREHAAALAQRQDQLKEK